MPIAGKTTFIRMLHGSLKPDDESIEVPEFRVSYKPQKISPKFPGSVRPPAPASGHTRQSLQAMHAAGSPPAACTWSVAALMLARVRMVHRPRRRRMEAQVHSMQRNSWYPKGYDI